MKPVVEGMGLEWSPRRRKSVEHPLLGICMVNLTMQMPGDDQGRVWTFVPLNRLNRRPPDANAPGPKASP